MSKYLHTYICPKSRSGCSCICILASVLLKAQATWLHIMQSQKLCVYCICAFLCLRLKFRLLGCMSCTTRGFGYIVFVFFFVFLCLHLKFGLLGCISCRAKSLEAARRNRRKPTQFGQLRRSAPV